MIDQVALQDLEDDIIDLYLGEYRHLFGDVMGTLSGGARGYDARVYHWNLEMRVTIEVSVRKSYIRIYYRERIVEDLGFKVISSTTKPRGFTMPLADPDGIKKFKEKLDKVLKNG